MPFPPLGEPGIHPEEIRREQRRFVAARAGADFEDDVPVVVGIARDEQPLHFLLERLGLRVEGLHLLSRQRRQFRVSGRSELARFGHGLLHLRVLAEPIDEFLNLGELLGVRAVGRGIGLDGGIADEAGERLVACFDGLELAEYLRRHDGRETPAPPDTGGRNATSSPSWTSVVIGANSALTAAETDEPSGAIAG